jgi:transcriptional/translational regulatory protein YebC/TACO1
MFERKSQIIIEKEKATEDTLMNLVLESGADDLKDEGDSWEILSAPESHETVAAALEAAKIPTASAEVTFVPKNVIRLEGKTAAAMIRMSDALEDNDDVQSVVSNFDVDENDLEAMA